MSRTHVEREVPSSSSLKKSKQVPGNQVDDESWFPRQPDRVPENMRVVEECAHLIKDSMMIDIRLFGEFVLLLQIFQFLRLNGPFSGVPLASLENMSIKIDPVLFKDLTCSWRFADFVIWALHLDYIHTWSVLFLFYQSSFCIAMLQSRETLSTPKFSSVFSSSSKH